MQDDQCAHSIYEALSAIGVHHGNVRVPCAAWHVVARLHMHAQAKAAARQERAAKIISLTSLILLLLAVSMYATILYAGFNPYIAAAALFCAGAAGYPLLTMLTHAVASQTSRSFKRLGPYDRCWQGCRSGAACLPRRRALIAADLTALSGAASLTSCLHPTALSLSTTKC